MSVPLLNCPDMRAFTAARHSHRTPPLPASGTLRAVSRRGCQIQGALRLTAQPAARGSVMVQFRKAATEEILREVINEKGLVCPSAEGVAIAVQQPTFEVKIAYSSQGKLLEGASKVWAHVGHSGWRDTQDVELKCAQGDPDAWVGHYSIPMCALNIATHLEVQLAFKGLLPNGHIVWDNNNNCNFSSSVELMTGHGLVTASPESQSQLCVSRLLVRMETLAAKQLLTPEQHTTLRTMAWMKDFGLLACFATTADWADADLARELAKRCGYLRRPGVHVIHIAAEMAPIAKVGGLADVVPAIAKAHQARGQLAEIILPKYDTLDYSQVSDLREITEFQCPWGRASIKVKVWGGVVDGLPTYFLEPHSPEKFFWRQKIYGCPDDAARFAWFSRAALEYLVWSGKQPDVLHVHDWQTGLVPTLLKEKFAATSLGKTRTILTIHNIAFQGRESPAMLDLLGLDRKTLHTPEKLQDDKLKNGNGVPDINILKGAVQYADHVTTVSPKYADEVLHTEFGEGLQKVLQAKNEAGGFTGVLNGIDTEVWCPRVDRYIARKFNSEDVTEGKLVCKQALLEEIKLPFEQEHPARPGTHPNGRPLIAVVSRLTEQKGLPLILEGLRVAVECGAQVVILGSAPDAKVQKQFEDLQRQYDAAGDVRIILRFDEGLSHRIYAGADMILIPSQFEPCGLTQLISMRYGTVPVVRPVGGLADTVFDVEFATIPKERRNGFWIESTDPKAAEFALTRAIDAYHVGWDWWSKELVPQVMAWDFGWERSAQTYLDIYNALVKAR